MAIQKDMRVNDLTKAASALKQQPQPAASTTKPAAAAATKPAAAAATKPAAAAATKATGSAVVATVAKTATKPASQTIPTNSVRGNAMAGISAAAATANAAATAVIQTTKVDTKDLNKAVNSAMKANAAGTVAKEQVKNAVAQNNKAIAGANLIVGAKPSVWLKALRAIAANFVSSFAAKAKNDAKLMDTFGFIKDSKTNKFILKVPKQPVSAAPTGITKPTSTPVIPTATKKVGFDAEFADFDAEFADDVNFNGSQRAATIAGIVTAMEEEDDMNFLGAERAATIGGILSAMKPVESKKISTSPVRTFQVVAPLTAGSGCVYNPTTKGYLAKQAFLPKVGDIVTGRIVEIYRTVPSIGGKGKVKVKQQGIYYTIRPFSVKPKAVLAKKKIGFDGEEELNFILQPSAATTSYAIWIPLNKLQEVVPPSLKQMIGFDAEFADADGDDDFDYEPDFVTRDLSFDGEDELNADGEEVDMFDEEMENASGEDLFDSVEISEVDESVGADGEEYEEVIIQKIIE
jgi:hypothetical protein